jgi:hypothetical protein
MRTNMRILARRLRILVCAAGTDGARLPAARAGARPA